MAKEKKKRSFGRKLFTLALLGTVGYVAYRAYSSRNASEDPWAAAYWEDIPSNKA